MQEATVASGGNARLRISSRGDIGQALISLAAEEHAANNIAVCKATEVDQESPLDDIDSDEYGQRL